MYNDEQKSSEIPKRKKYNTIEAMASNQMQEHLITFSLLSHLVNKYVNDQKNKKLYACFIDFKKAFDSKKYYTHNYLTEIETVDLSHS